MGNCLGSSAKVEAANSSRTPSGTFSLLPFCFSVSNSSFAVQCFARFLVVVAVAISLASLTL